MYVRMCAYIIYYISFFVYNEGFRKAASRPLNLKGGFRKAACHPLALSFS